MYEIENKIPCHRIIEWFEEKKDLHHQGVTSNKNNETEVDKNIKDTTDISLSVSKIKNDEEISSLFFEIFGSLQQSLNLYIKKYDILDHISVEINDLFNIQKYIKGQHFKFPHFESSCYESRKRILTWMIYLNDVKNGGRTVFPYYNLEVTPKEGTILIWPADYTHTHFGDIVEDEKYILTGWFNVKNPNYTTILENLSNSTIDITYF